MISSTTYMSERDEEVHKNKEKYKGNFRGTLKSKKITFEYRPIHVIIQNENRRKQLVANVT